MKGKETEEEADEVTAALPGTVDRVREAVAF
jgi:hypothetical protein